MRFIFLSAFCWGKICSFSSLVSGTANSIKSAILWGLWTARNYVMLPTILSLGHYRRNGKLVRNLSMTIKSLGHQEKKLTSIPAGYHLVRLATL